MASSSVIAFVLLTLVLGQVSHAEASHPIAGVISLLQDLAVQAKEEGAAEAALFQKFTYWCKTSSKSLSKDIKKEKYNIAELTDKIEGLKTGIETLDVSIAKLTQEISNMNSAAAKAKKVRDDEIELYKQEQDNFGDTIGAVDTAIDTMEDSEAGASALLQSARRKLRKEAPAAPDAKQYGFKSGDILETFKGMNTEFEGEKLDSEQQETNKQNAYNLAKQARDYAINAAQESKKEKEDIKTDKESDQATAETSKASEESALVADSTSLDDTNKECTTKTAEWDTRSAVRSEEIEAIQVAQKILTKVTGVRNPDTHEIAQKSLIAAKAHVMHDSSRFQEITGVLSFLQVDDPRAQAVNLLRQAAKTGHSRGLQDLAEQLRTYDGPLEKIAGSNGMLQKMIFRLMSEQKDEDDHKNWCDVETEKNTEMKDDKQTKMRKLKNTIKSLDASIKMLTQEISENNRKVSETMQYQSTETDLRNENHKEILATIKDSQDAQAAVTQATTVLKDFYKKSGETQKEPWEFLQTRSGIPSSPSTWDSSYSGTADPNSGGGVLAILDGVMQKFSTMEADSKAADETDQKNFDQDMAAKKVELATTEQDSQMKTSKKDSLQGKMEGDAAQLKQTTAAKDAVDQYLKDLEPACGTGDSSYGDRKAARSDEINALRKAQGILEEAFRAKAFLQVHRK